MGQPLKAILKKLGATQEGAADMVLDGAVLGFESVFGGDIGECTVNLFSDEAFGFTAPPELVAVGPLWMANVDKPAQVRSAVKDAHDRFRRKLEEHCELLEKLG